MPRKHGPGRGTRHPRGEFSGVTFTTVPSGVTIERRGLTTPSGNIMMFNAGSSAWAGTSISITHGMTTLYSINASIVGTGSGTSETCGVNLYDDGYAATLACVVRTATNHAMLGSGGTIMWTAMGLV